MTEKLINKSVENKSVSRNIEIVLLVDNREVHSIRGVITHSEYGDTIVGEESTEGNTKLMICSDIDLLTIYRKAEKMGEELYGGRHLIRINTFPYQD